MSYLDKIRASLEDAGNVVTDEILQEALQEVPLEEAEEQVLLQEQSSGIVSLESDEAAISEVTKAMEIVSNATTLVQESLNKKGLVRPDTLEIINNAVQAVAPNTTIDVSLEAEGDAPGAAPAAAPTGQQPPATAKPPVQAAKDAVNNFANKAKDLLAKFVAWLKDISKRIGEFFNKERILIKTLKGKIAQLIEKARRYSGAEVPIGTITQLGANKVGVAEIPERLRKSFIQAEVKLSALIQATSAVSDAMTVDKSAVDKLVGDLPTIDLTGGRLMRVRSQEGKFFVIEKAIDVTPSEEKVKLDRNAFVNGLRSVLAMLQTADKLNQDEMKLKSISDSFVTKIQAAISQNKQPDAGTLNYVKSLRNATPRLVATLRMEATAIYKAYAGATFLGGEAQKPAPAVPGATPATPAAA